jgi:hypothetical protein
VNCGPEILRSLPRAGAADGLAHDGAVEIFAEIDEREESVQQTGFHFVGEMKSAGGGAGECFALFADVRNYFDLTFVRGPAADGFATHFGAIAFNGKNVVMDANPLGIKGGGDRMFATRRAAGLGHVTLGTPPIKADPSSCAIIFQALTAASPGAYRARCAFLGMTLL